MSQWTSASPAASRRRERRALLIVITVAVLISAINVAMADTVTCNKQGCSDWRRPVTHRHTARKHRSARVHHHRQRTREVFDANGNRASGIVRSRKTGATAHVSPRYAARFQAYVDDLEAHGATIYYMGGIRPGRCSIGSQHPCGSALDVCQDFRGHVSGARDCRLPHPRQMAQIAKEHGLFEGSVWCRRPDYGHVQALRSGSECQARGTWGHGKSRRLVTITGKVSVVAR